MRHKIHVHINCQREEIQFFCRKTNNNQHLKSVITWRKHHQRKARMYLPRYILVFLFRQNPSHARNRLAVSRMLWRVCISHIQVYLFPFFHRMNIKNLSMLSRNRLIKTFWHVSETFLTRVRRFSDTCQKVCKTLHRNFFPKESDFKSSGANEEVVLRKLSDQRSSEKSIDLSAGDSECDTNGFWLHKAEGR